MQGFRLRYWKHCAKQMLTGQGMICFVIIVFAWIYEAQGCTAFLVPFKLISNLLIGAVLGLIVMIVIPTVIMLVQSPLYSVLDKYGFSREYLSVYEKTRINGKPFKLRYAVEYAEIFLRMGQPADAIKYLNTLEIPSGTQLITKVSYFYVYIMSALNIHNLDIADDMWRRSMPMINIARKQPKNCYMLYLALISVDMYAGQADEARLKRGYEQLIEFTRSSGFKNNSVDGHDFEILELYALTRLGRSYEADALYREITLKASFDEPLFTFTKKLTLDFIEKAKDGVFPFIY